MITQAGSISQIESYGGKIMGFKLIRFRGSILLESKEIDVKNSWFFAYNILRDVMLLG